MQLRTSLASRNSDDPICDGDADGANAGRESCTSSRLSALTAEPCSFWWDEGVKVYYCLYCDSTYSCI
jgi:hypothetical protein